MTTTDSRPTMAAPTPDIVASDATISQLATPHALPIAEALAVPNARPAFDEPTPKRAAPGGPDSPATIDDLMPSPVLSRGPKTASRHRAHEAHTSLAAGVDPAAIPASPPPYAARAVGSTTPPDGAGLAAGRSPSPNDVSLLDPALALAADILDDIERVRIANENRIRQLTRDEPDKDGEERGFGLSPDHPDVLGLGLLVHSLQKLEHEATLNLQRKLRKHPLHPWVKAQRGVGEKQAARLLAAIGDPYINSAKGEPRTVSALWAYCGLHVLPAGQSAGDAHHDTAGRNQLPADQHCADLQMENVGGVQHGDPHKTRDAQTAAGVAAKRRKGERAKWSTKAKMRAYLIAESCVKQLGPGCRDGHPTRGDRELVAVPATGRGRDDHEVVDTHVTDVAAACACSPYRVVYDQRRAHTATTHPDWTDGHSHNDALRVASKEILKDLWRSAKGWHATVGEAK